MHGGAVQVKTAVMLSRFLAKPPTLPGVAKMLHDGLRDAGGAAIVGAMLDISARLAANSVNGQGNDPGYFPGFAPMAKDG